MRDHDDVPYIVIERRSAGMGPFLWGALMGGAAALLLAPRTGDQTQEDIRRSVQRARTAAEDRIETARSSVTRTRDRIEGRIEAVRDRIDDVRDRIEPGAERAREAVHEGRRAARNVRDEVERRLSHARAGGEHGDSGATAMREGMGTPGGSTAGGYDMPTPSDGSPESPSTLT